MLRRELSGEGVARLTLDRPEVHNAFNDALIAELGGALAELAADETVRVLVLAAEGKSFSAGADLNWMKAMSSYGEADNRADALKLAGLMRRLDRFPRPTVALVQGPAFGGGVGLVACCDIAIAAEDAAFALTEVRLGLVPAVISPYVVRAIGLRAARRYMLTAERFDAAEARRLGLVHEVVPAHGLAEAGAAAVSRLLKGGPAALGECKALLATVAGRALDDTLEQETAALIARLRASPEGREGIGAFLERRKPGWIED
jgi:methylglutaconyl-CoA hydratase